MVLRGASVCVCVYLFVGDDFFNLWMDRRLPELGRLELHRNLRIAGALTFGKMRGT